MDLAFTPAEEAFRAEARAWLEAHVPRDLPSGDTREGFALHVVWEKKLFEARWSVVSWPAKYGGRDASLVEWVIFEEEYWRAGGPQRVTQNGIFLLAPTLFAFGTEEQKDRVLSRMAAAQDLWCQGWSEPNAGSDLAGIKSWAEKVDGGFKLYGQKTWCTRGAFCDFMFGLFRNAPTGDTHAERHAGMTYFMVPLRVAGEKAPGVNVRAVARLDGDDGFAEVFLDGAFVPDRDVIGKVGEGWKVAMATTGSERGLTLRSPGRFSASAERLIELARDEGVSDARKRDAVAAALIDAEAYRIYTWQTVGRLITGEKLGAESSVNKVFWSELDVRLHETALSILGENAQLDGEWMKGFQFALAGPIYAGTNEIQRNVIAERILGLPRK